MESLRERKRVFEIKRTKLDGWTDGAKNKIKIPFFITENLQKGQNDFLQKSTKILIKTMMMMMMKKK